MKMNNTRFFIAISSLLLVTGCAMNDVDSGSTPTLRRGASPVFTSSFENTETRTYVDSDLYMYWTADDRLTIFTTTYNQQYRFDGQTGANGGSFSKVNTGQFVSGNSISTNYGIYPYNASTALTKEEKIELELPAVQQYAVSSFGVGANTMVAVTAGTDDLFLPFKNVCGYLMVKLYGDVTVKKVIFEGNNGEKIAGAATVVASHNSNPEITMSENATTSITIDCGDGVELGKTADTATEFWFVIPPTTFSNGFTIKAIGDGVMMMKKSTTASRTIQRNIANSMPAIEAVFDTPIEGYVVFEDANFKAYCVTNFDKDHDGEVSYAEALDVTRIEVTTDDIESMSGIEHFSNLTYLKCTGTGTKISWNGKLRKLDVSKNTALTSLYCYSNQLTSLDVSNNTALTKLRCNLNQLTSLDISINNELTYLRCSNNQLTDLVLTNNTKLDSIYCDNNRLSSLDVSMNTELAYLDCGTNQLTSLDVSNNAKLKSLGCYDNLLTSLDVSANTELSSFSCAVNQLTTLDVSHNTELHELLCQDNQLTSLDISKNTGIRDLDCKNNHLTSLNLGTNTNLHSLQCQNNQLMSLDVSNNTGLTILYCRNNLLTSLDISNNRISFLYCENNHLTRLNLSIKRSLSDLRCDNNWLTNLDVSGQRSLNFLYCDNNRLTSLDIYNNLGLGYLSCNFNLLTSLDVSKNTILKKLYCRENPSLEVLWIKRGQSIFDLNYDSAITTIKYVDDITGDVAVLMPGPDFNATIKNVAYNSDGLDHTSLDETKVSRIVFNTLSPNTSGIEIQDTSSAVPIYLVYNRTSGVVNINTPAETIMLPEDASYMFAYFGSLRSIDNMNCLNSENVVNMGNMFCYVGMENRELCNIDLSSFRTPNLINTRSMFNGCARIVSLDLSNLDFSQDTSMAYMFQYCINLTDLNLGENFTTENVTNMQSMFRECHDLPSIDLSKFKTDNVERMDYMFYYCKAVETLDCSSFNTEMVERMDYMFSYCRSLTSVNVSSFNTEKCTNFSHLFSHCEALPTVDLSSFNTENALKLSNFFWHCYSLNSIDVSNFSFASATDVRSFFNRCTSLQSVDLSRIDGMNSAITTGAGCSYFFHGAKNLHELNFGELFMFSVKPNSPFCETGSEYDLRCGSAYGAITIYCDQDVCDYWATTGLRWLEHGYITGGSVTPIHTTFKHYKTGVELFPAEWPAD